MQLEKALSENPSPEQETLLTKKYKPSVLFSVLFCILYPLAMLGTYFVGYSMEENIFYTQNVTPAVVSEDEPTDSENALLTQIYTNEKEGFSVMYPEDWTIEDDPDNIVTIAAKGDFGIYAGITVGKDMDDISYFSVNKFDWEALCTSMGFSDAEVEEVADTDLDGRAARKVALTATTEEGVLVGIRLYFYTVGSDVYIVSCFWSEDFLARYKPILDAIVDSYKIIDQKEAGNRDILYNGVSVASFFTQSTDEVIASLGTPVDYNEYKLIYDDIEFRLAEGRITSAESFSPDKFTLHGSTLDKNRDELIELLGQPLEENPDGGSGYQLVFEVGPYELEIATGDLESDAWRLWLYSNENRSVEFSENSISEISYRNIHLTEYIGVSPAEVYLVLGSPTDGTFVDGMLDSGGEYFSYDDDVEFILKYKTDRIGWIVGAVDAVQVSGVTLNKTYNELIDLLGEPDDEGNVYDEMQEITYYIMRYFSNDIAVDLKLDSLERRAYEFTISSSLN